MQRTNWRKKAKIASTAAIAGLVLLYLAIVLSSSVSISTYHGISARSGYVLPRLTDECRKILAEADLHPYGKKHPPEFREYANIWLFDEAKTLMYNESVMEHATCLHYLLQRCIAAKQNIILVIYDRREARGILVIRNHASDIKPRGR